MKNQREIKFRAWDKETKSWLEDFDISPDGRCFWTDLQGNKQDEYNQAVLMQYTGLKDKNDKEIYEGDIIKDWYTNPIAIIIWEDNGFYAQTPDKIEKGRGIAGYEVIGNIYENPDLLK